MRTRRLIAVGTVAAATLLAASCGGGGGDDDAGGRATGGHGGVATAYLSSYPDYLDPALSYTQEGWQSLWTVYTPLLTYRHEEGAAGAELIPGLATGLPEVSEDGRTYTLELRDSLKYSDGSPVRAGDFEHTIKRVLNLESGGSAFYLGIEGAEDYVESGRARADIRGIDADDATGKITIRLVEPDATFPFVLAMNFAGLVPGDTPFENMTQSPPPGVGPFMLRNVQQNRGFDLVRNPEFPPIEGIPSPPLLAIHHVVVKNEQRQTQDIMDSKADYAADPPPVDQLPEVRERFGDRYEEFVTNSTYYYFLNQRVKPFDDERVRKAVSYAIDERAIVRLFGGLLEPDCNFLPPDMKGYEKLEPCPWGDVDAPPQLDRARQLVRESGRAGTKVQVWGNDEAPSRQVTEYLADVLNEIGLEAEPRIVEGSVYFTTIGNQKTRAQAGYANWLQDFPHPRNFLVQIDPASIQATNSINFGNVDDPRIGEMIAAANREPIEEAAPEYAAIDAYAIEHAHVVPYGHRKLANFVSERVDFEDCTVTHPVYYLDYTQLCLR